MSVDTFDVVVIGGGPGGYVAAIRAAQSGMRTALIERWKLGGTCLNKGCIPTKAMLHAAYMLSRIRTLDKLGITVKDVSFNYEQMLNWRDGIVSALRRGLEGLMRSNGVEVIFGRASFASTGELSVVINGNEFKVKFKHAIIATGSKPRNLSCLEGSKSCLLGEGALFMHALPNKLAVIGGGAIGVELAWIYSSLGCNVTLIELMPRVLPSMDSSISRGIETQLQKMGVNVMTATCVKSAEETDDGGVKLHWQKLASEPSDLQCEHFEKVIVAIGRVSDTESLNAHAAGVQLCDDGRVMVDCSLRTSTPHIYAIGDVIRGGGLAHQAMAEGELAVEALCGAKVDAGKLLIPVCIYTHPEVASVGLTEEQMRKQTDSILVGEFPMRANGRALTCDEPEGFVKVVGDGRTGTLSGVHIISAGASELISGAAFAIQLGMKFDDYIKLIRPHPTLSEALGEAAMAAVGRPLHIPKPLRKAMRSRGNT
ncbi:MAG: dihydrolipoyl dehydrogenase [Armatimonadota bacterium]|nr:dihydrolipoyl dehydrogenase [Armatimonadota bacterium]MCX7777681.1 dihydrolipoyl dehydrogenase [Armatimonadota bacterium]MDW8025440.1 dihydrolipoyl dehydrogenase [Armatimonadota bacterium]